MYSPLGLSLCLKYAHPPNYLELCGPVTRKKDIRAYRFERSTEYAGQKDLLSKFETLYPYLTFIASENHIADPFDPNVVSAYWIGNSLLSHIRPRAVAHFLENTLNIPKKLVHTESTSILTHTATYGVPFHSFHVLNIWIRTGRIVSKQTLDSMDNCMIHAGVVTKRLKDSVILSTDRLMRTGDTYCLTPYIRTITIPSNEQLKINDIVTYHWGTYCDTISQSQQKKLDSWNAYALRAANTLSKQSHVDL